MTFNRQRNLLGAFIVVLSSILSTELHAQTAVSSSSTKKEILSRSKTYAKTAELASKSDFIPFTYLEPVEPIQTSNTKQLFVKNEAKLNNESFNETNNYQVSTILSAARSYLGTPYRYGGVTRRGIDCSAFVQQSFASVNMNLPRVSSSQAQEGKYISKSDLQAGDLVFFATTGRGRVSHVGIVVENNDGVVKFIHAASSKGVSFATLNDSYWKGRYVQGRRLLDTNEQLSATEKKNSSTENIY